MSNPTELPDLDTDNVKTWPERIWLQHGCDEVPTYADASGVFDGITWCEDNINSLDVEYVRADVARRAQPEGEAPQADIRDCPNCEGTGRISPVELCKRCNCSGVLRRWDAAIDAAAPSAPGTPEAPADESKGDALWQATLRACGELPEGYEVRIELENGCGMAVWYDAEGERHVIDGEGYLSDDVNEAVDAAIQRAAQLDGGQGEGK